MNHLTQFDEDGFEILVVEAVTNELHVCLANGYGPKEGRSEELRKGFYGQMNLEIQKAQLVYCLICIEMDWTVMQNLDQL